MQSVEVSGKFQIAIPSAVRRQLGIKRGDRLLVDVRGNHILLMSEPADYAAALIGLHREVWEGVDAQQYVDSERQAWRS